MKVDNEIIEDQFSLEIKQQLKIKKERLEKAHQTYKESENQYLQGILCKYSVSVKGGLVKESEIDLNMGRTLMQTIKGNQSLTLSKCRKFISITNFDKNNPEYKFFDIKVFETRKFQPKIIGNQFQYFMNEYYFNNASTFKEVLEVSLCDQGRHIMMIYMEQTERTLYNQQDYEANVLNQVAQKELLMKKTKNLIDNNNDLGNHIFKGISEPLGNLQFNNKKENKKMTPRQAKKYAFFDIQTGKLKFEWGGVREEPIDFSFRNSQKQIQEIKLYDLGLQIKEVNKVSDIVFFIAGDFMDNALKQKQMKFDWGMVMLSVPIAQFLNFPEEKHLDFIKNLLMEKIIQNHLQQTLQENRELNYYPFNSNWILKQIFNWEFNNEIACDKRLDQFILLNQSIDHLENRNKSIYIHGPKFKKYLTLNKNDDINIPYHRVFNFETNLQLTRNNQSKDQLFYQIKKGQDVITYCCQLEQELDCKRVQPTRIPNNNFSSAPDCWLHTINSQCGNFTFDIFQSIKVDKSYRFMQLQTRKPKEGSKEEYEILTRQTDMMNQQVSNYPFFCHNLGQQRLLLMSEKSCKFPKIYIIEMKSDEKFVSFVEFNRYEDIGFYQQHLNIDCCSCFLYLTTKKIKSNDEKDTTRLNLLIADPYYDKVEVANFKSSSNVNEDIFKEEDLIIKCCATSTMVMRNDSNYSIYLWTQFPNNIIRQKLNKIIIEGNGGNSEDEDPAFEAKQGGGDDDSNYNKIFYEPVPMIKDDYDYLFYVVMINKELNIMEGNPKDPIMAHHQSVYKSKVKKCLAFSMFDNNYYIMDENKSVYMLGRQGFNRTLILNKVLHISVLQRLDYQPTDYQFQIITEKYSIHKSKIFYLYDAADKNAVKLNKLFDFEDLIQMMKDEPKMFVLKSSILFTGSSKFIDIYQFCRTKSYLRLFNLPDIVEKTLVNDRMNKVEMSTFLDDGEILIKTGSRYLHFSSENGSFISEVKFNNSIINNLSSLEKSKSHNSKSSNVKIDRVQRPDIFISDKPREQILDFVGNVFQRIIKVKEKICSHNKMQLIQMSHNNRFYLFLDRLLERFMIYELTPANPTAQEKKTKDNIFGMFKKSVSTLYQYNDNDEKQRLKQIQSTGGLGKKRRKQEFKLRNLILFQDSQMFKHMEVIGIDHIEYFYTNKYQVKVENNGNLIFCFTENFPTSNHIVNQNESNSPIIEARLNCDFIKFNKRGLYGTHVIHSKLIEFPREALFQLGQTIEKQKVNIEREINQIRVEQARLPAKCYDYSRFENLVEDITILEKKRADHITSKIYCDNLFIIYCGCFLKFGFIDIKRPQKMVQDHDKEEQFKSINLMLEQNIEIIKILETANKNWLSIYVIDHSLQLIMIILWDFENNCEQGIMQRKIQVDPDIDIENHLVAGMNQKMNYFINQDTVIDLEHNIPLRQSKVDQCIDTQENSFMNQLILSKDYYNQKKVNFDGQRFLGIEKPSCIFYPLSRMDILPWQKLQQHDNKEEQLALFQIHQFNLIFDGNSLFHYFIQDSQIIEMISRKYQRQLELGQFQGNDRDFPLQILNPDKKNKTAIQLAVSAQNSKSLDCMMQMLCTFEEMALSKMFLRQMPNLINLPLYPCFKFFDTKMFQTPQMDQIFSIPWDDSLEELVFASQTSIVSLELLQKQLIEKGLLRNLEGDHVHKNKEHHCSDLLNKFEQEMSTKKRLRSLSLKASIDQHDHDSEAQSQDLRRVKVRALDMDWLFYEDNFVQFLDILSETDNDNILVSKQIKTCIRFAWELYQPAIIKYIFLPYVIYLAGISYLSGYLVGEFNKTLYESLAVQTNDHHFMYIKYQCYFTTSLVTTLMLAFAYLELLQLIQSGVIEYMSDYWNAIDCVSITCNMITISMFTYQVCFQTEQIDVKYVRTFGAFSCFLMWLKVFYWMRLFSALAYYVKLIQDTIIEMSNFLLMVLIIIFAFSSFFYVINLNLIQDQPGKTYYNSFYGKGCDVINSIVLMYKMGALGDFSTDEFQEGYNANAAMSMFILASFIILVVFMNMLIAIMGDTFGRVQETAEENGLNEQVTLIVDHMFLIDIQKLFDGKKYLMIVAPDKFTDHSSEDKSVRISQEIKDSEQKIVEIVEQINMQLESRVIQVDINTQHMLNNQYAMIEGVQQRIKRFDDDFKLAQDDSQINNQKTRLKQLESRNKQGKILSSLTQELKGMGSCKQQELDIQEIAITWMSIADADGNGTLNKKEFFDFFFQIKGIIQSEEELDQIFEKLDKDGTGMLDVKEFANGIQKIIYENDDESNNSCNQTDRNVMVQDYHSINNN